MKTKDLNFIDEMFDDIDDPLIVNVQHLGFVESLILTSNKSAHEIDNLLNSIDGMRKSEIDKLVVELKDNQIHRDCREQYKEMIKNGVFNNK
tara:strand:- start:1646 stop:1921 length:276 start_codon:yes stop_codon:yes gene_type:complete